MRLIAVDPGLKGWLVGFTEGEPRYNSPMPVTGPEIDMEALRDWVRAVSPTVAVMEAPQTRPGHSSQSTSRTFYNAGVVAGILSSACPLFMVPASKWSTHLAQRFMYTIKETDTKKRANAIAKILYPRLGITPKTSDGYTDALCIGFHYLWTQGYIEKYQAEQRAQNIGKVS